MTERLTVHRRTMYTLLAVIAAMAVVFGVAAYQTKQAECLDRQRLYDGHIVFAQYLGDEFGASQERIDQGIARLRVVLGPRPGC